MADAAGAGEDEAEESVDELDTCIAQLEELGMAKNKIETLAKAVRGGKAPIEMVKQTIEKLKAAKG